MPFNDAVVREHALIRLSEIFAIPTSNLFDEDRFGHELKATRRSDFKRNELDVVDDDIKDVADRKIRKELASGVTVITTVKDYCDHMIRCNAVKPDEVAKVLSLTA